MITSRASSGSPSGRSSRSVSRRNPKSARVQDRCEQPAVEAAVLDQHLPLQPPPQLGRGQERALQVPGSLPHPGRPTKPTLDRGLPGEELGRLGARVPPGLGELGVDDPQRRQLLLQPFGGRRFDGEQRRRPGALHPAEDARRRARADEYIQAEPAELDPVPRGQRPQLQRGKGGAMSRQVGEAGVAPLQNATVVPVQPCRQRPGDVPLEPDQDGSVTGERLRPAEADERRRPAAERDGEPPGRDVRLDGAGADPEPLQGGGGPTRHLQLGR